MFEFLKLEDLPQRDSGLAPGTLRRAAAIVRRVRRSGAAGLRVFAQRWDGLGASDELCVSRTELAAAEAALAPATRELLRRTAGRIKAFAEGQRACLRDFAVAVDGYEAGHQCVPVARVGCYAPGGRYPLPSSVLMTVVTAKAAGVDSVIVASPRPSVECMAAASIAGADGLLRVGGAQAIAALAYGVDGAEDLAPCDMIVGPGNRYVTAAKQLVSGDVGIDMLAGPSELLVVADGSANPAWVAADLLAQAEHDPDAVPILITLDAEFGTRVRAEVVAQLRSLRTRDIAAAALANGGVVVVGDRAAAARACDAIAPEHLAVHVRDPDEFAARLQHCGALFIGAGSAEVLGDYGLGPNHVLPTAGGARRTGGLSVFSFLRMRTFIRSGSGAGQAVLEDAVAFAELEGLHAHACSAARRIWRREDGPAYRARRAT